MAVPDSDGRLLNMVLPSDQLLVTWQTSKLPDSETVSTKNFALALVTWPAVVPAGKPERSYFTRVTVMGDAATCALVLLPWMVELPLAMNVSSVTGNCAQAMLLKNARKRSENETKRVIRAIFTST
jgi:hypothetical protein